MADERKRITELPEAQATDYTDYVAIDSAENGTRKYPVKLIGGVWVTDDGDGTVTVTVGGEL